MTTIAIDSTLTMASDSQATVGARRSQESFQKVFEVNGYIIGIAGRYSEAMVFIDAFEEVLERQSMQQLTHIPIPQATIEQLDNFQALVITPDGKVLEYEDSQFCIPVSAPCAIGSGSDYAITAMDCGKSAAEAVEVAIKFDVFSGGDIQSMSLSDIEEVEVPSREERSEMSEEELRNLLDVILGDEEHERENDEHRTGT